MIKIEMYNLNVAGIVIRFYLMMAVAIILGTAGLWVPMAFIAGTIGVSAMMGVSFKIARPKNSTKMAGKVIQMELEEGLKKAS